MIRYKVLIVCEDGQWRNLFKDGRTFKQKKTAHGRMMAMFHLGKRANRNYEMKIEEVEVVDEKDQEITRLKKALEIANEAIGFYADKESYHEIEQDIFTWLHNDAETFTNDMTTYSGKRAREAQKQIKEVMEGK